MGKIIHITAMSFYSPEIPFVLVQFCWWTKKDFLFSPNQLLSFFYPNVPSHDARAIKKRSTKCSWEWKCEVYQWHDIRMIHDVFVQASQGNLNGISGISMTLILDSSPYSCTFFPIYPIRRHENLTQLFGFCK